SINWEQIGRTVPTLRLLRTGALAAVSKARSISTTCLAAEPADAAARSVTFSKRCSEAWAGWALQKPRREDLDERQAVRRAQRNRKQSYRCLSKTCIAERYASCRSDWALQKKPSTSESRLERAKTVEFVFPRAARMVAIFTSGCANNRIRGSP